MTVSPPQPLAQSELAPSPQGLSMTDKIRQSSPAPKLAKRPLFPPQAIKLRDVDIVILEDRCKGCSFCIEFCPRDVLEQDTKLNIRGVHAPRVKDSALCVGCGVCEEICPDFAIFLVDKRERR
jgi:2-oxoglutarate ferredoxin oxidoreductase subunit delta